MKENYPKCRTCRHLFKWKEGGMGKCEKVTQHSFEAEVWTDARKSNVQLRVYHPERFGCALHEEKEAEV
jgi:hypothetical protein